MKLSRILQQWRRIRALNYGTVGRTIHGVAQYSDSGPTEEFWFDPPSFWRTDTDGAITMITTDTDEYRRSPHGMVHTALNDGTLRLTSVHGAHAKLLVDAHRNWPLPGGHDFGALPDPTHISETNVHGRQGWRVEFPASEHRGAQTFVIDAETGMAIAWYSGTDQIELISYVLDEVFDPSLFTWTGEIIEEAEEMATGQAEHAAKQALLEDIPRPAPTWYPSTVTVSVADGDPATGAVDMSMSVSGPYWTVRRWLTGTDDPPESFFMSHYSESVREIGDPWTHELRYSPGTLTPADAHRILASIPPAAPPRPATDIVAEIDAARADHERALISPGATTATGVIYSGPVHVGYSQYYLQSQDDWGGDYMSAFAGQNNGLVGTRCREQVVLVSGLHTGTISVTVDIADSRPAPDTANWEEIVETPLTVDSPLMLNGWDGGEPGIELPISRGTYRLRYSANNMDAARDADVGEFIDEYRITIWPSPLIDDEVIKQTADIAVYWNTQAHR